MGGKLKDSGRAAIRKCGKWKISTYDGRKENFFLSCNGRKSRKEVPHLPEMKLKHIRNEVISRFELPFFYILCFSSARLENLAFLHVTRLIASNINGRGSGDLRTRDKPRTTMTRWFSASPSESSVTSPPFHPRCKMASASGVGFFLWVILFCRGKYIVPCLAGWWGAVEEKYSLKSFLMKSQMSSSRFFSRARNSEKVHLKPTAPSVHLPICKQDSL